MYVETVYVTIPLPLPLAPPPIVIHESLLPAVHVQPEGAVTATLPAPPPCGNVAFVGAMMYVQPAAPWLTVKVSPAIVIVPERGVAAVLISTE